MREFCRLVEALCRHACFTLRRHTPRRPDPSTRSGFAFTVAAYALGHVVGGVLLMMLRPYIEPPLSVAVPVALHLLHLLDHMVVALALHLLDHMVVALALHQIANIAVGLVLLLSTM